MMQPTQYKHIKRSIGLKVKSDDEQVVCDCGPSDDCSSICLNRACYIECPANCVTGKKCKNRPLSRGRKTAKIELKFISAAKGRGVVATADFEEDELIVEYTGEIVREAEMNERKIRYKAAGRTHQYSMEIVDSSGAKFAIDATEMGNLSRFINHGCSPNAYCKRVTVRGEFRMGIYSLRRIEKGEEITYNYCYKGEAMICLCGQEGCLRILGYEVVPEASKNAEENKDAVDNTKDLEEENNMDVQEDVQPMDEFAAEEAPEAKKDTRGVYNDEVEYQAVENAKTDQEAEMVSADIQAKEIFVRDGESRGIEEQNKENHTEGNATIKIAQEKEHEESRPIPLRVKPFVILCRKRPYASSAKEEAAAEALKKPSLVEADNAQRQIEKEVALSDTRIVNKCGCPAVNQTRRSENSSADEKKLDFKKRVAQIVKRELYNSSYNTNDKKAFTEKIRMLTKGIIQKEKKADGYFAYQFTDGVRKRVSQYMLQYIDRNGWAI